jgi:hypothetical protein
LPEPQKPQPPASRPPWFWVNLVGLLVLIPCATVLFQRHFKAYFTEIVLFGGFFTAWMLIRLLWSLIEKALKVDTNDFSQRLLASPSTTRLLLVATLAIIFLWNTTASLYLDAAGADDKKYLVQVIDPTTQSLFMQPAEISASAPVAGMPWFMQFRTVPLRCRIVSPVGFETTDCSLVPGESKRIQVPRGFNPLEIHLIRLIPSAGLYRALTSTDDSSARPDVYAEVTVRRAGVAQPVATIKKVPLRRETLYLLPTNEGEKALVLALEQNAELRSAILNRLIQAGTRPEAAQQTVEVLSAHRDERPLALLRKGDVITIEITRVPESEGAVERLGTVTHEVTTEKLQTVWLSQSS